MRKCYCVKSDIWCSYVNGTIECYYKFQYSDSLIWRWCAKHKKHGKKYHHKEVTK